MDRKPTFSPEVQTLRFAALERQGAFNFGAPDPMRLEIGAVDDTGAIKVLVFERDALEKLSGVLRYLDRTFPDAFPR